MSLRKEQYDSERKSHLNGIQTLNQSLFSCRSELLRPILQKQVKTLADELSLLQYRYVVGPLDSEIDQN
jgi:hypothetical protein